MLLDGLDSILLLYLRVSPRFSVSCDHSEAQDLLSPLLAGPSLRPSANPGVLRRR
jgi:hypothetical protein